MIYNKLVRDKIPEHIREKGGVPVSHVANDAEYWQKLKKKLSEEVLEFQKDANIEELADILEVIDAIITHKDFKREEIKKVKEKKGGRKREVYFKNNFRRILKPWKRK